MTERFKVLVLKTSVPVRVPGVRIPEPPHDRGLIVPSFLGEVPEWPKGAVC